MFRPITENMQERVKLIKGSMSKEIATEELAKCESLEDFHWFSEKLQNGIYAQMELYVLENYEKVPLEVWNTYNFKVLPQSKKNFIFFGKEDEFTPLFSSVESLVEIERKRWEKSVKIDSIMFTLDPHDGDFSVNFNQDNWCFLWKDEVFEYYAIIKDYLTKE